MAEIIASYFHLLDVNFQLAVWDRVLLAMMRGGFSIGWRCFVVSGIFSVGVTSANVIRNYVQPVDHALIGFGVGAFYRYFR
jgi:hypothetical protein